MKHCNHRKPNNPESEVTHKIWLVTTNVVLSSVGDVLTNFDFIYFTWQSNKPICDITLKPSFILITHVIKGNPVTTEILQSWPRLTIASSGVTHATHSLTNAYVYKPTRCTKFL